jgi:hypothetical protein
MKGAALPLSLAVQVFLTGCASTTSVRPRPISTSVPPPPVSACAVAMKASYPGELVNLGNCAGLVGLRPLPKIRLIRGQTLMLLAPIANDRPPLPTSTNPRVLRLVGGSFRTRIGVFKAVGRGVAKLIIEHPPSAVCIEQPTRQCVVASISVAM